MALYEYECPSCGVFEVQQKMSDAPLTQHDCGQPVVRRISLTSFALKGGGWYSDGYASTKKSAAADTACKPSGCEKPGCAAKAASA